jgi:hypothetical protein
MAATRGEQIRPITPTGNAASVKRLENCWLEVDDDRQTVTWHPDQWRGKERTPLVLGLPGAGPAPHLSRIARATYRPSDWVSLIAPQPAYSSQLWFIDESGRVVGRSGFLPGLRDAWPDEVLEPLTRRGVQVLDPRYQTVWEAKSSYRGAVPRWWLKSRRTVPLVVLVLLGVIVGAVFLIAALS